MNRIANILLATVVLSMWYLAVHRPVPAERGAHGEGRHPSAVEVVKLGAFIPDAKQSELAPALPARPQPSQPAVPQPRQLVVAQRPEPVADGASSRPEVESDGAVEEEDTTWGDNRPELAAWRRDWNRESQDNEWTRRTFYEVADRAVGLASKVEMSYLSCRETTCHFYLQFADQLDAKAYIDAQHASDLDYEYQSLDPEFDGAGFDRSDHMYEVFIRRTRPEHLSQRDPADRHQEAAVMPSSTGENLQRVMMPPSEATAAKIASSLAEGEHQPL